MGIFSKLFGDSVKDRSRFNSLVQELIDIGSSSYRDDGGPSFFWKSTGVKNIRVTQIGVELYKMGGNRLSLMQEALSIVVSNLGGGEGDLSWHWHKIGEQEWGNGNGECWLA